MADYAFFSQGSDWWGKDLALFWGHLNICPTLQQFQIMSITQSEVSSLTGLKAWGDEEKFCHDIAFLLVSAEEEAAGDRKYGLVTVWVNPCQARVPTMEEAVRELTIWVSSGPDWPYVLVHTYLPGRTEWMQGPYHNLPAQVPGQWHKPNWRQIHLLRGGHPTAHRGGARPESVAPWQMPPILMASSIKTIPLKLEREVSMTMEVRGLLSQAMLDTSGHVSGNSTPKRPNPTPQTERSL